MLKIGQFSKYAKTTIKTLRHYDKIGLLKPAMIDADSRYRYYSIDQLETIRLISTYKKAGIPNDIIFKIIHLGENETELLNAQKQVLFKRAKEIEKALAQIDGLIDKKPSQNYSAEIKRVEKRLVYCCRGYIASTENIHDFVKTCTQELFKTNPDVKFSEPDYCCVIYPDDCYRESNVFIEYAQSVDRVGVDTEVLKFKEIKPITAISILHHGSYDTLQDAYLYAINWASENGYELEGEPRERYINGKWNVKKEQDWLTELQFPIKEKNK